MLVLSLFLVGCIDCTNSKTIVDAPAGYRYDCGYGYDFEMNYEYSCGYKYFSYPREHVVCLDNKTAAD